MLLKEEKSNVLLTSLYKIDSDDYETEQAKKIVLGRENDGKEVADPNEDGEEEVSFNENSKL